MKKIYRLLALLIIALALIIITTKLLDTNTVPIESNLSITINPSKDISNSTNDINVYVDENYEFIEDENTELLENYGIKLSNEIDDNSNIMIDINGETNFELDTSLTIHTFTVDNILLQYNLIIQPDLVISQVMVVPYVHIEGSYVPVYDLVLYTGSYDEQTKIYEQLNPIIDNLTYIPLTPYEYITEVDSFTPTTVINKNSCLSSDFEPQSIDKAGVEESERTSSDVHYVDTRIIPNVEALFADLQSQGVEVIMDSAYRSYSIQESLYGNYVSSDGVEVADTYSARPGCSEHQTGIAFDITTTELEFGELEELNGTEEADIIYNTAPKYGFIVRYPEDKTHITQYSYESWHLRYVGAEAANIIYTEDITLDQYSYNSEYYNAKYE